MGCLGQEHGQRWLEEKQTEPGGRKLGGQMLPPILFFSPYNSMVMLSIQYLGSLQSVFLFNPFNDYREGTIVAPNLLTSEIQGVK